MPPEAMAIFVGICLGIAIGMIAASVPTWLFLRGCQRMWGQDFAQFNPGKQWVPIVYPLALLLNLFGWLALGTKALMLLLPSSPFLGFCGIGCLLTTSTGVLNGLFEMLTGVSPVTRGVKRWRGLYVRAPWLHQYIYEEETVDIVRKAGIVRIALSLTVILLPFLVSWLVALGQ